MHKLVFVGDFNSESQVKCLEAFLEKYSGQDFEICISGHNLIRIADIEKNNDHIVSGNLSSDVYIYELLLADHVFVFDQLVSFTKYKYSNQKVIRYIPDDFSDTGLPVECDETVVYDPDDIKTDIFPDIEDRKQLDFLLIIDSDEDLLRDRNGLLYFLKQVKRKSYDLILGVCEEHNKYCSECNEIFRVNFSSGNRYAQIVADRFDGIVIYFNDTVKTAFEHICETNSFRFTPELVICPDECKLFTVADDFSELIDTLRSGNYSRAGLYRKYLKDIYDREGYDSDTVSIILTRYNTPYELVSRGIRSCLECGHPSVEVIVVDDGSRENIENLITDEFGADDGRIHYYYKDNEGPGPARNYGIERSAGKHLYYLDSDDTVQPGAIPLLLAHLRYFDLPFVAGKRVLCDPDGVPLNESLRYLSGSAFNVYYNDTYNPAFEDKMVNNKLYVKDYLKKSNIRFCPGFYEDLLYTAELFAATREWHVINVHTHNWYQYGQNTSISSSVSYSNYKEKIDMLDRSWDATPEVSRYGRFPFIFKFDFLRYYKGFESIDETDRQKLFEDLHEFIASKESYINLSSFTRTERDLLKSLMCRDRGNFERIVKSVYTVERDEEPHDNYIVFTHYHLVVSIIRAIHSRKPSRLYVFQGYSEFQPVLINKIRQTGVFSHVEVFFNADVKGLMDALDDCPEDVETILPTYLYTFYARIFKKCDLKNDNMIIFSDSHPYWYYLHRDAAHIIKHEDAYNSFDREFRGFELYGLWGGIQRYVGGAYPEIHYRSDRIESIIVSSPIEGLPAFVSDKIRVEDTMQIAEEEREKLKEVFLLLYGDKISDFTEDCVLLLTQPLYLYEYCTEKQLLKVYKKMCAGYEPSRVIVKPHPADTLNYRKLGFKVAEKNIPIEVYNYIGVHIKEALTFSSTAVETITFADRNTNIFPLHDFEYSDIKPFILDYIKPPKKKKSLWSRAKRKAKRLIT